MDQLFIFYFRRKTIRLIKFVKNMNMREASFWGRDDCAKCPSFCCGQFGENNSPFADVSCYRMWSCRGCCRSSSKQLTGFLSMPVEISPMVVLFQVVEKTWSSTTDLCVPSKSQGFALCGADLL